MLYHRRVENPPAAIELATTKSMSRPEEARVSRLHSISSARLDVPKPDHTATDDELLGDARMIVNSSIQDAIEWARAQDDETLRRRCLTAVLHAWAEREPVPAVDWALAQDEAERQSDLEAALAGVASAQPAEAAAIVRGLLKYYDPADNVRAAPSLVVALNNAGEFGVAMDFIKEAPPEQQSEWMPATFRRWGATDPQEAIQALDSISNEKLRGAAFEALIDGWSAGQPAGAAEYAASLPDGADRTYALNKIMDGWALQDPTAMASWLANAPAGINLDRAIVTLITRTDSANRSTDVVLEWAEHISDSQLKQDSIKWVMAESGRLGPAD